MIFHDGSFGLVYSEVKDNMGPVIQGTFPKYSPEIEKVIILRSLPHKKQDILTDIFTVYQISPELLGISYLRKLASAKTLSGSSIACLTWVTDQLVNPFVLKPVLESVTLSSLKVYVDDKLIEKIVTELIQTNGVLKMKFKHSGIPITFSVQIPAEEKLPEFFLDLNKSVSAI